MPRDPNPAKTNSPGARGANRGCSGRGESSTVSSTPNSAPMAAAQIGRRFAKLGGRPVLREGVVTDNGGLILDIHGLAIVDPAAMEAEVSQWPGVVCCGIFARNRASICLLGTAEGVRTMRF